MKLSLHASEPVLSVVEGNYELRTTVNCLLPSTSVEIPLLMSRDLYKPALFMQNKANFPKARMNVTNVLTKDYESPTLGGCGKNKANSNPIKANTNPIKANIMPKQPQNKPEQTQFPPRRAISSKFRIISVLFFKFCETHCSAESFSITFFP